MRFFGFEMTNLRKRMHNTTEVEFTYIQVSKFLYFKRVFDLIRNLDGDVVECGVGPGHSLLMFSFLAREEGKRRKLWGFDSFEGFPKPSLHDKSERNVRRGEWSVSIPEVKERLLRAGLEKEFFSTQVTLVRGWFQNTLPRYRGDSIALLHIDCDLYESYKMVLDLLYPKVCPGGAILFDEYMRTYEHLEFPGASKAIDEFFGEEASFICRDKITGKYYLIKGAHQMGSMPSETIGRKEAEVEADELA